MIHFTGILFELSHPFHKWRSNVNTLRSRLFHVLKFCVPFLIVGGVYILLPHLRLPKDTDIYFRSGFALIAVLYLFFGFLTQRNSKVFGVCRSFVSAMGTYFLILNFLPISYLLAQPILIGPSVPTKGQMAVILGGGVFKDGTPTEKSMQRTVRGIQLYHAGKASQLLFSTGATSSSQITEAEAMAQFARSLGVPQSAILLEPLSRNTDENAKFSAKMLQKRGIERVYLVTGQIHMHRSKESFEYYGIQVDPIPAQQKISIEKGVRNGWNLFHRVLHEYLGIVYYRLRRSFIK